MNPFDRDLAGRLAALRERGLYRELRRVDSPQGPRIQIGGETLLNFSSNDYLGLAHHPALQDAALRAIERQGTGSGASRLICGSLSPHHELEDALAAFKGTEAALSFSSGYTTALGTLGALVGPGDVVILDRLVHACIVDAARLSGAKLRVFAHNDLDELERILKWAGGRAGTGTPRTLLVTESLFSMDGDTAPLREMVALKERHGAWLMVDEAHATGLFGPRRRGLAEALGVGDRIEVQMGTLGKALGAAGGYIAGSRTLVDFLINRARSFIFSTAPPPASAAAAMAAVQLVQSEEGAGRAAQLWNRVAQCQSALRCAPPAKPEPRSSTPILPLIVGDETQAVELATALRARGVFAPAIRYPTVARGQARLRITVTAAHEAGDITALGDALDSARQTFLQPS